MAIWAPEPGRRGGGGDMLPGDAPLGAGEGLVAEAGDLRGIANMCIPPRGERRFSTNPGMGDSVGIGWAKQRTGDSCEPCGSASDRCDDADAFIISLFRSRIIT
eukprot:CAMPEP_0173083458 /NCGR_PEP_ID=MMETSP1102-20130122/19451_1 /TAXON_ID=49646 /ORGANISM="Geminigera sp., Strain Caron Lab Isolate" /LENGTH=103 /DNA_ID=CAMNT_0013960375 /DNA_START=529 /DNA_END=840 /DNA_ORIENTATION=-